MYWLLTRQVAQDNWLLTGWRKGTDDQSDIIVTPYIEFEDGAGLKEFLRLNAQSIHTTQVNTALWLTANNLRYNKD